MAGGQAAVRRLGSLLPCQARQRAGFQGPVGDGIHKLADGSCDLLQRWRRQAATLACGGSQVHTLHAGGQAVVIAWALQGRWPAVCSLYTDCCKVVKLVQSDERGHRPATHRQHNQAGILAGRLVRQQQLGQQTSGTLPIGLPIHQQHGLLQAQQHSCLHDMHSIADLEHCAQKLMNVCDKMLYYMCLHLYLGFTESMGGGMPLPAASGVKCAASWKGQGSTRS